MKNSAYVDVVHGGIYTHRTYNMGMVDANNRAQFLRWQDPHDQPRGKEHAKYNCPTTAVSR